MQTCLLNEYNYKNAPSPQLPQAGHHSHAVNPFTKLHTEIPNQIVRMERYNTANNKNYKYTMKAKKNTQTALNDDAFTLIYE